MVMVFPLLFTAAVSCFTSSKLSKGSCTRLTSLHRYDVLVDGCLLFFVEKNFQLFHAEGRTELVLNRVISTQCMLDR